MVDEDWKHKTSRRQMRPGALIEVDLTPIELRALVAKTSGQDLAAEDEIPYRRACIKLASAYRNRTPDPAEREAAEKQKRR